MPTTQPTLLVSSVSQSVVEGQRTLVVEHCVCVFMSQVHTQEQEVDTDARTGERQDDQV